MSDTETPSWGIEPVPERLRVLGVLDGFLLWANLSVSLLVIVAGAFLVLPASDFGLALSLPDALGAIVAAAIVGNLLLALGGLIGADARVPTMVLMRAPLGRRGSYLPTGLNVVQCLGWSVFELIVIATGASALSQQVLGFGGIAFWKILFGVVATILAFLGPVGFVRKYVRKFAVWVVIASLLYLSWWSLHGQRPVALWHRDGAHAVQDTLLEAWRHHSMGAYYLAFVPTALGDHDQAFSWLDRSVRDGSLGISTGMGLGLAGLLADDLGADPRWGQLRKRLGLENR